MNFDIKDAPLQEVANGIYYSSNNGVVVELHYDKRSRSCIDYSHDVGEVQNHPGIANTRIKYWGHDNMLPDHRDVMLMSSNIVGELISAKRDLLVGQGICAYKDVYDDETGEKTRKNIPLPPLVDAWLRKSRWNKKYLQKAVINYYKHSTVFIEFMKAKDGSLLYMKTHDCKYVRCAEKVAGYIPGFFICADWSLPLNKDKSISVEENKLHYIQNIPEDWMDAKELPDHFMMMIGDELFHDGYYHHPAYWGGEDWIDLANNIPVFHKANIKNGYAPRFHIKVPADYFLNKQALNLATTSEAQTQCLNEAKLARKKFVDDFNSFLAGLDNAGRAFITSESFDPILKEWKGLTIESIDYDMKDEALLKLFEKSNQANISAQGFHPSLAGIETQGKLSSGAEIRNLLMYFIIRNLPRPRMDILEPFDIMLMINGWYDPEIKYTFEDVLITKLDEDKSGVRSSTEQKPEDKAKSDDNDDE
jgi:hypothetical protein